MKCILLFYVGTLFFILQCNKSLRQVKDCWTLEINAVEMLDLAIGALLTTIYIPKQCLKLLFG
jgi:hypothetical protein